MKNQWQNTQDVYDDVRDVISDPQVEDFQLPEAIERRSAEAISLEEEAREWQKEIKRLKQNNMLLEWYMEKLGDDIQSSQLTDNEPDDITQDRLQRLTRPIEGYPKLAALLFQDEAIFKPAIDNMKRSGSQLLSKLHNFHKEAIRQEASKSYHDRLDDLVKPLRDELAEMQDQLESAQTVQSTTNTELTNVKKSFGGLLNNIRIQRRPCKMKSSRAKLRFVLWKRRRQI